MGAKQEKRYGFVMAIYLLGIFIGAIDTGILTPARTVVQNSFGVDERTGIWMITAFTLSYACAMPILGKLADRVGRRRVYMVAVALFGTGSLICGLSNFQSSFSMLIIGRVIQAFGGGGIMPLATAEFGTGFPEHKRGLALGLVGGVYGIANILGATLGSAILNFVGTDSWQWLFFINLPVCLFVVAAAIFALPKGEKQPSQKIDIKGTLILVALVLSLMYSLNNIDFFNFGDTILQTNVYPFLVLFALLIPLFLFIEKRAADPIFNIGYFRNKNIIITFVIAFVVGVCMMGMVFVPQFAENALKTPEGSGGYFVTILGVFAGIGGPMGGKLVDKFGPKKILLWGFAITFASALFLALYATVYISTISVIISLVLMGTGLGFVMGTPLNYMMLSNTKAEESNSALSALSLMRSIGTTIGPVLMIGFIAQAGITAQDRIMNLIPPVSSIQIQADETLVDSIRDNLYAAKEDISTMNDQKARLLAEIDALENKNAAFQQAANQTNLDLSAIENDPQFKAMLEEMDVEMPQSMNTPNFSKIRDMLKMDGGMEDIDKRLEMLDFDQAGMDIDMAQGQLPDDVLQKLSSSSVTTIVDNTVYLVDRMFEEFTPDVIMNIQDGIQEGISGIQSGIDGMGDALVGIDDGIEGINSAQEGISLGVSGIASGINGMNSGIGEMNKAVNGIKRGINGMQQGIGDLQTGINGITQGINGMQQGIDDLSTQIAAKQQELQSMIEAGEPPYMIQPLNGQLQGMIAAMQGLTAQLNDATVKKQQMEEAVSQMTGQVSSMKASIRKIKTSKASLDTLINDIEAEKLIMEEMIRNLTDTQTMMEQLKERLVSSSVKMASANDDLSTLKNNIPAYFVAAEENYVQKIKAQSNDIEAAFQSAINIGFRQMYYAVAVSTAVAAFVLVFYKKRKTENQSIARAVSKEAAID